LQIKCGIYNIELIFPGPVKVRATKTKQGFNKSQHKGNERRTKGRRWELKHYLTQRVAEVNTHAYGTHVSWVLKGRYYRLHKN